MSPQWMMNRFHLPAGKGVRPRVSRGRGESGPGHLLLLALAILSLATGCATPRLQPAAPQLLSRSELAFIRDGVTTREELVLKLGIPSAQVEGDRILMYQFRSDEGGKWHLVSPRVSAMTGLREWGAGTCSLVVVFGADGVLQKHSMVTSQ
jgi:hypothetical protein